MSVAKAFEFHEYLNECPPADEILAAVHLKPKSQAPKSPKQAMAELQAMGAELPGVGKAAKMPPHLKAMLDQALKMQEKLQKAGIQ